MCAALPRLDGVLFTGGIGENSAKVRARTLAHMAAIGLKLDEHANDTAPRGAAAAIHAEGSPAIWVIPTDEERQIAQESLALLDH
jgi:acetate kinase